MHQHERPVDDLAHTRQSFTEAMARRDAKSAAAAYAEDARLLPPLVDLIEGREEILAFWQAGIDSGISSLDLEPLDCIELEACAYELGRYAISAMTADADTTGHIAGPAHVVERGRYITVHQLIDGRWLRAVEMFASDNQPGGVGK